MGQRNIPDVGNYSMVGAVIRRVNAQGKSTYTERKRINGVMKVIRSNVPLGQLSKEWQKLVK